MQNVVLKTSHHSISGKSSPQIRREEIGAQIGGQNLNLAASLIDAVFTPFDRHRSSASSHAFNHGFAE
jgi:hypothetical protein